MHCFPAIGEESVVNSSSYVALILPFSGTGHIFSDSRFFGWVCKWTLIKNMKKSKCSLFFFVVSNQTTNLPTSGFSLQRSGGESRSDKEDPLSGLAEEDDWSQFFP